MDRVSGWLIDIHLETETVGAARMQNTSCTFELGLLACRVVHYAAVLSPGAQCPCCATRSPAHVIPFLALALLYLG